MKDGGKDMQRCSLADVAEVAGVSTATVSRVLSNTGPTSASMRSRVLEAVRETGYVPNGAASALARRRSPRPGRLTNTVAMAVAAAGQEGYRRTWEETCEGVLEAADELGFNVSICLIGEKEASSGLPPQALMRAPVDGILAGFSRTAGVDTLPRIAPTVLVGSAPPVPVSAPVVEADHEKGIRSLVAHLAELGHGRVEYAPWTMDHLPYRLRAAAFRQCCQERGLAARVAPPVNDRVEEYVRALLARPAAERPSALVACSDGVAVQTLHALLVEGLRVPDEMSVVGFDGRPWGADCAPPLTSWRVHWKEMGRKALRVLASLLETGDEPARTLVGGELVVRGSSAPPRRPDGQDAPFGTSAVSH